MPPTLRDRIATLATEFADEILAAVRESVDRRLQSAGAGAPLNFGGARRRGGRRTRETLAVLADRILSEVRRHSGGIRAENLRANVGLARSEIGRPVAMLLAERRIRKTGEKRRTTYYLAERGATAAAAEAQKGNGAGAGTARARAARNARATRRAKPSRAGAGKAKKAKASSGAGARGKAAKSRNPGKKAAGIQANGGAKAAATPAPAPSSSAAE